MIQPFISHRKKRNGYNGLKTLFIFQFFTMQVTHDCVRRSILLFHQLEPWSDLVWMKLYRRKNNMIEKQLFRSLWRGLLTFADLDKICLYILFS